VTSIEEWILVVRFAHPRILPFPFSGTPAGSHLDALRLEQHGSRTDLLMDYQELQITAPLTISERENKLWEKVQGKWVPRRVRFRDVQFQEGVALYERLPSLPEYDKARELLAMLCFRSFDGINYYVISPRGLENPDLVLAVRCCLPEERSGAGRETTFERDWSPVPPCPPRPVPLPHWLHRRFGGDPIHFWMDDKLQPRRLFIGSREFQSEQRPRGIHSVFNYGDEPSLWTENKHLQPGDHWTKIGEGSDGISPVDLAQEAQKLIERLRAEERVLVHCSAGMNRSVSVCCAALIKLENLSAEAALERVRQHHPWARPDPRYWLKLRWLAQNQQSVTNSTR